MPANPHRCRRTKALVVPRGCAAGGVSWFASLWLRLFAWGRAGDRRRGCGGRGRWRVPRGRWWQRPPVRWVC
eukprot:6186873-Heterocapsa_arctica.AAC.1